MAGGFNVGGLMSGLDSNTLISQLMQLERQPIIRYENQISALEAERTATQDVRTQLLELRNNLQDFRFSTIFDQYDAASSDEEVLLAEVSGADPVIGSYEVETLQLASATVATSSAAMGAAINPNAALNSSGINREIEGGTFTINGVEFTVDPDSQTLNQMLASITSSGAGVTASYDVGTDRVTFENATPGDTSLIVFGSGDDTSSLLEALNVRGATQSTGAGGSTEVTSTRNLGAVDATELLNAVGFADGGMTNSTFRINGTEITVDTATDSLSDVLGAINDSDAQVTASYDNTTDTIRLVSNVRGSRTISIQNVSGNFLDVTNLDTAVQDAGRDAQFKLNGGAVQTRNTNEVADAIGGVTLNLLSVGTTTVTVSGNDDAIVEDIQEFIDSFNASVDMLHNLGQPDAALAGDSALRVVENTLRSQIFNRVLGYGDYASLAEIGITTGDNFDSSSVSHLELDQDEFRDALRDNRVNVQNLFSNSNDDGVADTLFDYLDSITRTSGFLYERTKSNGSLDRQIQSLNDQIDRTEERVARKEEQLRRQFTQLEQLTANYQQQGSALSGLGGF